WIARLLGLRDAAPWQPARFELQALKWTRLRLGAFRSLAGCRGGWRRIRHSGDSTMTPPITCLFCPSTELPAVPGIRMCDWCLANDLHDLVNGPARIPVWLTPRIIRRLRELHELDAAEAQEHPTRRDVAA